MGLKLRANSMVLRTVSGVSPGRPRMYEVMGSMPASLQRSTAAFAFSRVMFFLTRFRISWFPLSMPKQSVAQPAAFMASRSSRDTVSTRAKAVQRCLIPRRIISSQMEMQRFLLAVKRSSTIFIWRNLMVERSSNSSTTRETSR
ncbi:MAG: hypothetical protein BWY96_02148 [Spirochaetes bacterium ADurb.BinA120]|nr:MAG: hypothetical protein BWY96_02148 [Spirochaetes bacterium ADurb.BinA120]